MANSGSMIIYHRLIKPFVKKHEKTFDEVIDVAKDAGKKLGQKGEWCWLCLWYTIECKITAGHWPNKFMKNWKKG